MSHIWNTCDYDVCTPKNSQNIMVILTTGTHHRLWPIHNNKNLTPQRNDLWLRYDHQSKPTKINIWLLFGVPIVLLQNTEHYWFYRTWICQSVGLPTLVLYNFGIFHWIFSWIWITWRSCCCSNHYWKHCHRWLHVLVPLLGQTAATPLHQMALRCSLHPALHQANYFAMWHTQSLDTCACTLEGKYYAYLTIEGTESS